VVVVVGIESRVIVLESGEVEISVRDAKTKHRCVVVYCVATALYIVSCHENIHPFS
jgi:hypothetical protein